MWSFSLPRELYDYVISFIQPEQHVKLTYDFCLVFIQTGVGKKNMKRCTLCLECQQRSTYNQLCRKCDQYRWFELT